MDVVLFGILHPPIEKCHLIFPQLNCMSLIVGNTLSTKTQELRSSYGNQTTILEQGSLIWNQITTWHHTNCCPPSLIATTLDVSSLPTRLRFCGHREDLDVWAMTTHLMGWRQDLLGNDWCGVVYQSGSQMRLSYSSAAVWFPNELPSSSVVSCVGLMSFVFRDELR